MKNFMFLSIFFSLLLGCSDNNPVSSLYHQYDYSIEQTRSCYCPNSGEIVKIFVRADTIAKVTLLSDNSDLPYNKWGRFRTIKGLSDEVARLDTSTHSISVSYDPVFHYPSMINVSLKPIIVNDSIVAIYMDAWYQLETRNFTPYP